MTGLRRFADWLRLAGAWITLAVLAAHGIQSLSLQFRTNDADGLWVQYICAPSQRRATFILR